MIQIKRRKADILYSQYIREKRGWQCERCFIKYPPNSKGIQCSHYFGRAAESVRFSEDNCDVLCFSCHQYFTSNPNEYREWKLKKLGAEGLKNLTAQWAIPQKRDDAKVIMIYKKLLKELT